MELQDLAKRIGVKNILVSHINDMHYKDNITVIINDDIALNLVGKTYTPIPLTANGINKSINTSAIKKILDVVKKELDGKKF